MRTNPPGVDREEGEGKNPTVVGEPGGLKGKTSGGGRFQNDLKMTFKGKLN